MQPYQKRAPESLQATQMRRFPSVDHTTQGKLQAPLLDPIDDSQSRRQLKIKIGEDSHLTETPDTVKRLEEMEQRYQRIENLLLQISQNVGEMKG